ncbi:TPA_asm: polyprotein [Erysimum virus 1]|uniref:Replicase n=1 Tax=Erysimum virus 1 TaxID=2977967 RepID=A0A9N6YJK6_9RHAB|nr:TPA_asm: polyprotein [Erysimum virus 1]
MFCVYPLGNFEKYKIFIPDYQQHQWKKMVKLSERFKSSEVGLLRPSQDILTVESPRARISQSLYKSLVKIVGRSLEKRNINIPLCSSWNVISGTNITVDLAYIEAFRFSVNMACMVSEAARGGKNSYYDGILIENECAVGSFVSSGLRMRFIANNSFCLLEDYNRATAYYGSFDSLLLLMDTLGQRICLDIGCQVAQMGDMMGVPSLKVLKGVISVGDMMLQKYGNAGYEFIAMFESLVVSTLLKKNPDKITDSNEFFNNCRGEVVEMVNEGIYDQTVIGLFDAMSEFLIQLSNHSLSNLFCIYRIWGHPRVDIKEGMMKVMQKGLSDKRSSAAMAKIVVCQFRKMFLTEFYNKLNTYPPCTLLNETSYVAQCIKDQLPVNTESSRYTILDYDDIEINKMWELPETYDVCHILNDKAVSPTRSEIYQSIRDGKGAVLGTERRGIIRWLNSDSIRCKEFLKEVDEKGIEEDSLIIGMYEKEREIKIKARMFSLMSEQMRMYFVLTEEMISEHLLKYFPQITMKDPLHIQIKKLWNVSGISSASCLDPVINIDFEKWNLNMREEFTSSLFKQMDKMFGYSNLISRTHEIFESSYIYSSSGKYSPEISSEGLKLDPPMCYIGHKGGFEGLRQKGWTVATVCLLSYIADKLRVKINLLGQGDNQVIRIYMPHSYWNNLRFSEEQKVQDSKKILSEYIMSMDNYFTEAGLPIKIRETWKSTRLYMYGKAMYMDGESLPQWTKKLLRSYALSNEGTLTISGVIGTIATNMCAAAHASEKPDIMYALFLILGEWSLEYLFAYHPFTREMIREGDKISFHIPSQIGRRKYSSGRINLRYLMTTILMIPTSVGGSISIPLFGFIIRGFPDNASEGYSWLKFLSSVKSEFKDLFENWYSFLPNDTQEYDMLIQSPYSLNHKKPPTPGLQSRDTVREWLLSGRFKSNSFISNMTVAVTGFDRKFVCLKLMGKRINPLILHELYNSFPQVYLDQILRRVENTRTIRKLALKLDLRTPIVTKLMEIETEFLGYLFWRGFQKGTVFSSCATKHCKTARNIGWGVNIKGITTPHPMEFLFDEICDDFSGKCSSGDYIYVRFDRNGDFPPYLGSNVKTKVVSLQDLSIRAEPLVSIASKLLRYASWLNLGPFSLDLIKRNISVVCDTSVFKNVDEEADSFYSGCVEHRFNPSSASEGCFINYSPQVGKKVFLSSDCMPRFGRGNTNYTLHFQALYSTLQYVAAHLKHGTFAHYHLKCEDCITPVDDEVDDISDFAEVLQKLYTEERVAILRQTLGYLNVRVQTGEDNTEDQIRSMAVALPSEHNNVLIKHGVHVLLSCMCATMIMYSPRDIPEMIGNDDLQAFPRTYAYKTSSPKILEMTVDMLFVIKASRMREELDDIREFALIKEKLLNQLMKVPLDKFKGLGSILLGRTFEPERSENPLMLNLGEFPENPSNFLNSARSELIHAVSKRASIREDRRRAQIPVLSVNDKVLKICLISCLFSTYKCQMCNRNAMNWVKSHEEFIDCPAGHMNKVKRKYQGIALPMDIAVKMMQVLPQNQLPLEINGISSGDIGLMRRVEIRTIPEFGNENPFRVFEEKVRRIKRDMMIRLPTGAIYKWDHIFSFIPNKEFSAVLVFGDGTGYTSLVASRRMVESAIYPTALLESKKLIPQDLMSMRPFASRRYANVFGSLLQEVPDDLTDPMWLNSFTNFVSRIEGKILIISDVEGEKGNRSLVDSLMFGINKCDKERISFVHKIYMNEWSKWELKGYLCVSPYNNLQYGECFISDLPIGGIDESFRDIFAGEQFEEWIYDQDVLKGIQERDVSYFEAAEISLKISRHTFYRSYIPLSDEDMQLPPCALMYKMILYVSSNFRAPSSLMVREDKRIMLDGVLIKLIKGFKMMMIMLYGWEIQNLDYFKLLHISKADRRTRLPMLENIQMIITVGIEEHVLSKKEVSVASVMRIEWLNLHKHLPRPELCMTLSDFYIQEIIPGKKILSQLRR